MVSAGLLANVVTLVAVIWMTVVASRQSVKWAMVVFLVPLIGPCAFAYRYWGEVRKSFFVYLGGLVLLLIAIAVFIARSMISTFSSVDRYGAVIPNI